MSGGCPRHLFDIYLLTSISLPLSPPLSLSLSPLSSLISHLSASGSVSSLQQGGAGKVGLSVVSVVNIYDNGADSKAESLLSHLSLFSWQKST